ncbi:hypothetical protein MHC_00525 [Mycoplasma haemocanis str. Illinois]|uniref:Uncharacterized protein n=1 Tax=Mycoplasma haemocanis (strain Illinois) TaxID=1111676 RepID=H6N5L1_MYCHN|nr:hypothetical protein [Mycoplasma haemocanis]AEW44971.1 hypothetical protein MHC_00525 [Mycoplasma haemocanis str. Illinois]
MSETPYSLRKELDQYSSSKVFVVSARDLKILRVKLPLKEALVSIGRKKYQIVSCPWLEDRYLIVSASSYDANLEISYSQEKPDEVSINGTLFRLHLSPDSTPNNFFPTAEYVKLADSVKHEPQSMEELSKQAEVALREAFKNEEDPLGEIDKKEKLFSHLSEPRKEADILNDFDIGKKDLPDIPSVVENKANTYEFPFDSQLRDLETELANAAEFKNNVEESVFHRPIDYSKTPTFWFKVSTSFKDSDFFWQDLKEYWLTNSRDLNSKLNRAHGKPPVFSRKEKLLNIPALQEIVSVKVNRKFSELQEKQDALSDEINRLSESLIERGLDPVDDRKYQELVQERNELLECVSRSKKIVKDFEDRIQLAKDRNDDIRQRFFLDIQGNPYLISQHEEEVTNKLIDLNFEVNKLHEKHLELETFLIQQLRSLEKAKLDKTKVQFLEQQELLDRYQEESRAFFDTIKVRKHKERLMQLGELHEASAKVQEQIENEQRVAQYYIDNLRGIKSYEDYEKSLKAHKQARKEFQAKRDEFNRYFYRLKVLVRDKERKFNDFFEWIKDSLNVFQNEISDAYTKNDVLLRECVQIWWNRWNSEALPIIKKIFTRYEQVLKAFSPIPALCVGRIYSQAGRLREKADKRQREWEKLYGEVRKEFKKLGYELSNPNPSELEGKYVQQLDTSKLRLSESSRRVLFLSTESFTLNDEKDELVGLDPKFLDDDQFAVIDQVWSTLTPEQEKTLQDKFDKEDEIQKEKNARQALALLKKDQMKNIERNFEAKMQSVDQYVFASTKDEKRNKFKEVEEQQLDMWKREHDLTSMAEGEFKDTLYNLSKQLFDNQSVCIVNSEIVLSDTGFVEDGGTEIYSEKDYFIKPQDKYDFDEFSSTLDLGTEDSDIHEEPDDDYLDLLENIEYPEPLPPPQRPPTRPTLEQLAQISIKKYQEARKHMELDSLREKQSVLDLEVRRLSKFHAQQEDNLEKIVVERRFVFDSLEKDLGEIKSFLGDKAGELEQIFRQMEDDLDVSFAEVDRNLQNEVREKSPSGPSSSIFGRWFR